MKKQILILSLVLLLFLPSGNILATSVPEIDLEAKYKADLEFVKDMIQSQEDNATSLYEEIERINAEFKSYITSKSNMKYNDSIPLDVIEQYKEDFLDYGDELGIFEPQSSGFTVGFLRAQWAVGASTLSLFGFTHTAATLSHSLQDNPPTLVYQTGSGMSEDIKDSNAFTTVANSFKNSLPSSGQYYSIDSSFALTSSNSSNDLYLSLHLVRYLMAAEKVGNTWNIYTLIYDTYDFEHQNFAGIAPSAFVTLVNNYAAESQELGAIVPYLIQIYIEDTH